MMANVMRQVRLIAAAELKAAVRQRSLHAIALVAAALLLVTGGLGALRARRLADERGAFQQIVRAQWEAQPDRHPHRVAHFGSFAFRPPGALAAFDFGVDAYVGTMVFQEAHRQNTTNFGEAAHASSMLRFGQASPAMVIQTVIPLLVVFWGFAAVAGERERGTLALLRAQGVGPRTLVLGKAVGLLAALFLVVGAPMALVFALLVATGAFTPSADGLARVALLLGVHAAYLGAWVAAIVAISARARTARGALATGLSLWVAAAVLVPRAGAALAQTLHPAPSRIEQEAAIARETRAQGDSHDPNDLRFSALMRQTLQRHGVSRVEDLPINYNGVVMRVGEEIGAAIGRRHREALLATYARQDRTLGLAALLTPLLPVRALSMALAATGPADFAAFEEAAERDRYEMVQRLNALHEHEIRFENDRQQRVSRHHWQEIPTFHPPALSLREGLRSQGLPAIALLAWVIGAVALLVAPYRAPEGRPA